MNAQIATQPGEIAVSRTILIIDDNPNNLGVIADYLETFGFRILVSRDGEGGIARARYARPDIILLDVMMPGIDGFETCRRLKADQETCDIPVIFMTALTGVDEKVQGFEVGAVDYVTKPIQHEEVLARINTHLRLRELTVRLQRANEELVRLSADKDKFFSIVAHDLRGLFLPLLGNAELLATTAQTLAPADIKEMSSNIYGSGRLALDLLEHLLEWARVRMDRLSHQPAPLNLYAVAEHCVRLLAGQATDKDILLSNTIPADLMVFADEYMLATAIRNLISNALKFTPVGGQVTITGCADPEANMVSVTVHDTGVGMSKEQIQRLFEGGSYQSTLGTRQERGSGLGLVICREMIERNGGILHIESMPGQGSSFTFTIPRADPMPASVPDGLPGRAIRSTATILLIDYDPLARLQKIQGLQEHGFRVLHAESEAEALLIARRHTTPIDLLITDLVLPQQSGATVAAQLIEIFPNLRVLFTADDTRNIASLINDRSPGIGFLARPFTPDDLGRTAHELIEGDRL